jgi:hypothetical protein
MRMAPGHQRSGMPVSLDPLARATADNTSQVAAYHGPDGR